MVGFGDILSRVIFFVFFSSDIFFFLNFLIIFLNSFPPSFLQGLKNKTNNNSNSNNNDNVLT